MKQGRLTGIWRVMSSRIIAVTTRSYAHKGWDQTPAIRRVIFLFASSVLPLFLILFVLLAASLLAERNTADSRTISGKWKFNLSSSNMANVPVPRDATLVVSVHENRLLWRETGVAANGIHFDEMFDGPIDGRPHPLKGTSHVTIAFHRDKGAIVGRWKGEGKRLSIAKVSQDGRSLTVENMSNVYNMVSNWTTSWDRVPNR